MASALDALSAVLVGQEEQARHTLLLLGRSGGSALRVALLRLLQQLNEVETTLALRDDAANQER